MIAIATMWAYDLNLYTIAYFDPARPRDCSISAASRWRSSRHRSPSARARRPRRVRLSRAATFQSLSLLAITAYFAIMAVLVTALRGSVRLDPGSAGRPPRRHDGGGDGPVIQPRSRLGKGQDRQTFL
jgi:hypothetical protein